MDKLINQALKFVEKYAPLLFLFILWCIYRKFFGGPTAEEKQVAVAKTEHDTSLLPPVPTTVSATASTAVKKAAAQADVKKAEQYQISVYSESLYKATSHWNFQLPATRIATITDIGKRIEKYKISLSAVVAEYKKAGYGDLLADVKGIFGTAEYVKWLSYAGKVK